MLSLLRIVAVRRMRLHPLRPLLTTLGVALGVALFLAIALINRATVDFFRETVASVSGKASLSVVGDDTGVPEGLVEVIRAVPGVKSTAPLVEAHAIFKGASRETTMVVFGVDLLADTAVRSYRTSDERVLDDPLVFLNQADSIILTQQFATENHLGIDSRVDLMTAFGNRRFTVRGLLTPSGAARAFGGDLVLMDIDGARVMFGKEGKTDRYDIVVKPGSDPQGVARAVEAAIGPPFRVERPESQSVALERMVVGYQTVLSFLSYIALLVAFFLVFNAVAMSVAERRAEIGVLRALGASRPQVLIVFGAEALGMGLTGGVLGVGLGRVAASMLATAVSASMRAQYGTPIEARSLTLTPASAALAIAVATIVSVVAALWPALGAAGVPPVEAVSGRDSTLDRRATRRRATNLIAIVLLACLPLADSMAAELPRLDRAGIFAAVIGCVLAAPWIVGVLLAGVDALVRTGRPLERAGIVRLACDNLRREPARTGRQLMTLVVGLLLVTVMATIHGSFETSMVGWLDRTLDADLLVSSSGRLMSLQVQPVHEDLAREIDEAPGVWVANGRGAHGFRCLTIPYEGKMVMIKAWDEPHPATSSAVFEVTRGTPQEAVRGLFHGAEPSVVVSDSFAKHFGKGMGDTVELATPSGPHRFPIVAEIVDYGSNEGVIYLSRDAYKSLWKDPLVTAFAVRVSRGADPLVVKKAIEARLGADRGVIVVLSSEMRRQLTEVLDETFAYTHAIELAALVVGLLGLFTAALASSLKRGRELGMLRAIGMSAAQLRRLLLVETMLLGVTGGVAAVTLGAYISRCFLVGSLTRVLGWIIVVKIPWSSALVTVAAGLAIGAVAGLLVAGRVSRVPIREALGHE